MAHGIIALDGLGSDAELVARFVADYTPKLTTATAHSNAAADLDATPLGSRRDFSGLCLAFDEEVNRHPSELQAAVSGQLAKRPRLLDGLSGAAFHALIHLGLGLRASSRTMVVEGLAYLVHSWLPVGGADSDLCTDASWGVGTVDLLDALAAIRIEGRLQQRLADSWPAVEKLKTGYFQKAMHAFAAHHEFAANADVTTELVLCARSVHLPVDTTEAAALLLRTSLNIYVRTVGSDYFLLHCVTAAFSLVAVQPLLAPHAAAAACRRFVLALLATYVAQRMPVLAALDAVLPTTDANDMSVWATLREVAISPTANLRNEHAYKLVWLCLDRATTCSSQEGDEEQLLYAAARKALGTSLTGRTGERPIVP